MWWALCHVDILTVVNSAFRSHDDGSGGDVRKPVCESFPVTATELQILATMGSETRWRPMQIVVA